MTGQVTPESVQALSCVGYTGISAIPSACMRRFIVLFLLFLLPIEVLAGIVYEPALQHGKQAESMWFLSTPSVVVHDVSPDSDPLKADAAPDVSLDLGEASDIVACLLKMPDHRATSPPRHIAIAVHSVVLAVPIPPAIR